MSCFGKVSIGMAGKGRIGTVRCGPARIVEAGAAGFGSAWLC